SLQPGDVHWCTADVGWITGHTYVVYGPLLNGVTSVIFEGALNHPDAARPWALIERHKVNVLYTAPTAIRGFMRAGDELPARHNLSSLRLLGSVGEPINPEAWLWYHRAIGHDRLPIVDTWWQTETGGIMLTTLPGTHAMKPGSAGLPLWGVDPAIVDRDGRELGPDEGGFLILKRPWPGLMQTIFGDDARYRAQYWSEIPHAYFSGDGARRDADGYVTIVGRIDDVLNVAGHRLGTMEVESALVSHPSVAEAAVVGRPDPVKGEGIVAFVVLKTGRQATAAELREHVAKVIGAIARPDDVRLSDSLPKTRSGKIMRRFLRQVASGQEMSGDTSTLEDANVIKALQAHPEDE
ncbi:MAG TPA: AMP-binding protein, partial [Deinococcales bacterium]|nr:AMP-binding protein [Deinococcales bacterium]